MKQRRILPTWQRYALALLATGLAALISLAVRPAIQATTEILLWPAILLSAWFGGLGPGLLASVLSALLLDWLFIGPGASVLAGTLSEGLNLVIFLLVTMAISAAAASRHAAEDRAAASQAQTQRAAEQSERLQRVTAALAQALTPRQAAEVVVEQGAAALEANSLSLALLSDDRQWLSNVAQLGYPPEVAAQFERYPISLRVAAADVARTGQALWVESAEDYLARYPDRAAVVAALGMQAAAAVPLRAEGRVLGVLVATFSRRLALGDDLRRFISTLADSAALALERARLFEAEQRERVEAERMSARLGSLQAVSAALTPALTAGEVFDVVLSQAAHALGASASGIYLPEQDPHYLTLAASLGYPDAIRERVQRLPLDGNMPAADVFQGLQPLWLRSNAELVARYPHLDTARDDTHNESVAVIPLLSKDRALGVLALSFAASRDFSPEDRDFLLTMAGQCALALQRTQLYESARRLNAELEQRVQARTAELKQSETRFQLLVNSVQDYAIFMLDPQGYVASWNIGAQRLKGYAPDEIIGQHFSRFYTPEDVARGWPAHSLEVAAREGHYELEGWRVRRDGSRFWADVVLSAVRDETGELIGFAKVTRDLTERRQADADLRESESRLQEAQRIARLGSLHWDMRTNAVTWSDELCRIYGVTQATRPATFEQYLTLVHPDDRALARRATQRALQDHLPFAFDHRIVTAAGDERTLHVEGRFLVDGQEAPSALSATSQDITERKQIEEEVRQSREQLRQLAARLEQAREEERRRLAHEIHDELGGSLTGLKMDVARLKRSMADKSDELSALSAAIDLTTQTVRRIATELRPAILDDFGLIATIDWLVNDFQQRMGLAGQFVSELETLDLGPDANIAVYRVVQESLTNIARHAQATKVQVSVTEVPDCVVLRIADNGQGFLMSAVAQKHSLGLAGMRERVHAFAGVLDIESAPGRGATITVKIPKPQTSSS